MCRGYGGCCIHCACKVGGRLIHCVGIRVTCKRNIGGRHTGMCAARTYIPHVMIGEYNVHVYVYRFLLKICACDLVTCHAAPAPVSL